MGTRAFGRPAAAPPSRSALPPARMIASTVLRYEREPDGHSRVRALLPSPGRRRVGRFAGVIGQIGSAALFFALDSVDSGGLIHLLVETLGTEPLRYAARVLVPHHFFELLAWKGVSTVVARKGVGHRLPSVREESSELRLNGNQTARVLEHPGPIFGRCSLNAYRLPRPREKKYSTAKTTTMMMIQPMMPMPKKASLSS